MPRFSDEWLIDRTLFDYVQGGSCACCSFNFMPNGTAGLIESMSEFETDAANAEVNALDNLPWPADMKDQVWMERVRLRQFCKSKMKDYRDFWKDHGEDYELWFREQPSMKLRRLFQLPRAEIVERLKVQDNYHFHAAFGTVLCGVTEQVAHFPITKYPVDGRGQAEVGMEEVLLFDRRGGFTLKNLESEETQQRWLVRHKTLGGPKLLERNSKSSPNNDDDDDDNDNDNDDGGGADDVEKSEVVSSGVSAAPSFRSDRRIIRLLIARHFADVLQAAYLKERKPAAKAEEESLSSA